MRARLLLLVAGCIFGTYPVLLRALNSVGGEPLPAVFVTFARYQFLSLFVFIDRCVKRMRGPEAEKVADSAGSGSSSVWMAGMELAAYAVAGTLLSIFGVSRVTAVTSEILSSMIHMFVPLLTLFLVGNSSCGAATWAGCILAFCAALVSCIADQGADSSGDGGDRLGALAIVASSFLYGLGRVRASMLLSRGHDTAVLNASRMTNMGALSIVALVIDVACGGPSAHTLVRVHHIAAAQWVLLALSVFLSAFIAASLQFSALNVLPAANAQPFFALQPLFAALWSQLLLSEPITRGALIGGALMIGAALLACTDSTVAHEDATGKKKRM